MNKTEISNWLTEHTFNALMGHGDPLEVKHGSFLVVFPHDASSTENEYYYAVKANVIPDKVIIADEFVGSNGLYSVVKDGINEFLQGTREQGFNVDIQSIVTNGDVPNCFTYVFITLPANPVVKKESDS